MKVTFESSVSREKGHCVIKQGGAYDGKGML